jgi:hypothetical protein
MADKVDVVVLAARWGTGERPQEEAQGLLAYDLAINIRAAVVLLENRQWGPVLAFGRLIQERMEYLTAAGADSRFAVRYLSAGSVDEEGRLPRVRSGDARGVLRRLWSSDMSPTAMEEGFQAHVDASSNGSASIHPTPLSPTIHLEIELRAEQDFSADRVVTHIGQWVSLGSLALCMSLAPDEYTDDVQALRALVVDWSEQHGGMESQLSQDVPDG